MEFAYSDYAHALLMGNRIDAEERNRVLDELTYYSGLDRDFLDEHNLRFGEIDFLTNLCPNEIIGMYDSRLKLPSKTSVASEKKAKVDIAILDTNQEPFQSCVGPVFDKCMDIYYDEELSRPKDRKYKNDEMMSIGLNWDYKNYEKDTLKLPLELMEKKNKLRILFVNGKYDLSSTFDFMIYYLSQYDLPKERIEFKVLESGHASYIGGTTASELSNYIRTFINGN